MTAAVICSDSRRKAGWNATNPAPNSLHASITAKVAGRRYFNVFAASDTLFSRGATTGFPYNCASRRTGLPVAGGADELEMPCSFDDVAVRSKRADRSCRRCPRNDKTLELQHFRHPLCLRMRAWGCEHVCTRFGITLAAAFLYSYRPLRKKQS